MENIQPYQILVPFGIAAIIAALLLIWGDRPGLAASIRQLFSERPPRDMSSERVSDRPASTVQNQPIMPVPNRTNEPTNTGSSGFTSQTVDGTKGAAFALTNAELLSVQMMVQYRDRLLAAGDEPTKSDTILAGFGIKRGGSARYLRASEVYDQLFGEPEPAVKYPALDEHARPIMKVP